MTFRYGLGCSRAVVACVVVGAIGVGCGQGMSKRLVPVDTIVAPANPAASGGPAANSGPPLSPPAAPEEKDELPDVRGLVADVERSGFANDAWTEQARALFATWRDASTRPEAKLMHLGEMRCFARGCYVHASHLSVEELETTTKDFFQSPAFADFGGDVMRSTPEPVDDPNDGSRGRFSVVFLLSRPDQPRLW